MDGKYGRLFTEDDVLAFVFLCCGEQPETSRDRLRLCRTKFPADEPLFLLRGQDQIARGTVDSYASECERLAEGKPHLRSHAKGARAAADAMYAFSENHPERVKLPGDPPGPPKPHGHRPVA